MNCVIIKNNDDRDMKVSVDETHTDYVKVIRCKDCVHKKARNPIYVNEGRVYCFKFGQYMLNEDFCSYGKKPEYLFFGEAEETV